MRSIILSLALVALAPTVALAAGPYLETSMSSRFLVRGEDAQLLVVAFGSEDIPSPPVIPDVPNVKIQPDGLRGVQLTSEAAYKCRPSWSPDHKRIAYLRYPEDRPDGLELARVPEAEVGHQGPDVQQQRWDGDDQETGGVAGTRREARRRQGRHVRRGHWLNLGQRAWIGRALLVGGSNHVGVHQPSLTPQ